MRVCAVLEAYDARVHAWVYGRERERANVTVCARVCVSASRGTPFAPAPRRMPPTRATGTCARGRWRSHARRASAALRRPRAQTLTLSPWTRRSQPPPAVCACGYVWVYVHVFTCMCAIVRGRARVSRPSARVRARVFVLTRACALRTSSSSCLSARSTSASYSPGAAPAPAASSHACMRSGGGTPLRARSLCGRSDARVRT